jgi:hypothetical protein
VIRCRERLLSGWLAGSLAGFLAFRLSGWQIFDGVCGWQSVTDLLDCGYKSSKTSAIVSRRGAVDKGITDCRTRFTLLSGAKHIALTGGHD